MNAWLGSGDFASPLTPSLHPFSLLDRTAPDQLPFTFIPSDAGQGEPAAEEAVEPRDCDIREPPLDDKQNFRFCFDLTNTGHCGKGLAVRRGQAGCCA